MNAILRQIKMGVVLGAVALFCAVILLQSFPARADHVEEENEIVVLTSDLLQLVQQLIKAQDAQKYKKAEKCA